jgi:hypothetical protein
VPLSIREKPGGTERNYQSIQASQRKIQGEPEKEVFFRSKIPGIRPKTVKSAELPSPTDNIAASLHLTSSHRPLNV